MSIIKNLSVKSYTHKLPKIFNATWDSKPRESLATYLVTVETDDGFKGFGLGDSVPGYELFARYIIGQNPLEIDLMCEIIDRFSLFYARYGPIEMALWDLLGKVQGKPVYKILNSRNNKLDLYASTGTIKSPEEFSKFTKLVNKLGFHAIKIRFQENIESTLDCIDAVRESSDYELDIMVDCNQAWRMPWDTRSVWDLKTAVKICQKLSEKNLYWIEEPLYRCDYSGMRILKKEVSSKIAAGEFTKELGDLFYLAENQCVDILQPDVILTCGFRSLLNLASKVKKYGVLFTPHTWANTGAALMANAHLLAGITNKTYLEYPFDPPVWDIEIRDHVLEDPIKNTSDGQIILSSQKPGFGISVREILFK